MHWDMRAVDSPMMAADRAACFKDSRYLCGHPRTAKRRFSHARAIELATQMSQTLHCISLNAAGTNGVPIVGSGCAALQQQLVKAQAAQQWHAQAGVRPASGPPPPPPPRTSSVSPAACPRMACAHAAVHSGPPHHLRCHVRPQPITAACGSHGT